MSEMVDRVAKALCERDGDNWDHFERGGVRLTTEGYSSKDGYMRAARAAIAAMREPTRDMSLVGEAAGNDSTRTWRAMIDEALR
jgi:hypothetical protein